MYIKSFSRQCLDNFAQFLMKQYLRTNLVRFHLAQRIFEQFYLHVLNPNLRFLVSVVLVTPTLPYAENLTPSSFSSKHLTYKKKTRSRVSYFSDKNFENKSASIDCFL